MISKLIKIPDIIIVEDHLVFRKGLNSFFKNGRIAHVIGEASNGVVFIELLNHLQPDLVLMDIDMPEMNGIEATQKAKKLMPDLKIIASTMFENEEYYIKMIDLGVKGFILKTAAISELEKAIQMVMKGECYFSNDILKKLSTV